MRSIRGSRVVGGCALALLLALGWQPTASAQVPQESCGNEGEAPCPLSVFNAVCDTGLQRSPPNVCGCVLRGLFGNCLIPKLCTSCQNLSRRISSIDAFASSWTDWALRNQRDLAQDEPLNWVMHLGTHNSFNSSADGHVDVYPPNQFFSMTDQLRSGARLLTLDLHYIAGAARLCHSAGNIVGGGNVLDLLNCLQGGNAFYPDFPPGYRYYANGIKEIRNWLQKNPSEIVILDFEDYTIAQGGASEDVLAPLRTHLGSLIFNPLNPPLSMTSSDPERRWPTRRELLNAGKRVIVLDDDLANSNIVLNQGGVVGSFTSDWFAKNLKHFPDCPTSHITDKPSVMASITVEERELSQSTFGTLDAPDVASAAECNYSFIVLDKHSQALSLSGGTDFARQTAAVWSWKQDERGQHGDCAMLESSSKRWVSADCATTAAYACAKPRSESGLDPLQWANPKGHEWQVTQASGPWANGQAACQTEFPGYVFGVPVNGYQNRWLKDANANGTNLWLNYSQREVRGKWVIGHLTNVNSPPVAVAGSDQNVECRSTVKLDGSASTDADGDPLTYTWTGPFGTLTGATVDATLDLGTHAIALTVADGKGGIGVDSLAVTVSDTTAPTLSVTPSPAALSSPNGGFVDVVAQIDAKDSCDAELPDVKLISIVSRERSDTSKIGNELAGDDADIQDADFGTDDREFRLRARPHRIYTVTYLATDQAGNSVESSTEISVEESTSSVPNPTTAVPTMAAWGKISAGLLLAALGVWEIRRRTGSGRMRRPRGE